MKYYTGIGSRETPIEIKWLIRDIAEHLNGKGYTLRSGGAPGADSYFEGFADKKEIYLPWKGFNGNQSDLHNISYAATAISILYHPAWDKLSEAGRKLMSRNVYQVLGQDLKTPSEFVICWTRDGKDSGGTGQAIRIARANKIPVCNLKIPAHVNNLLEHLGMKSKALPNIIC